MTSTGTPLFPTFSELQHAAPGHALAVARARIQERERSVRAWAHLPGDILPNEHAESGRPLAGTPFAVKDVIDVAGMPTRCGSPGSDERPVDVHAACVDALYQAGALPIGKTVTAEYAFRAPGPTHNPCNLAHTPGGSSSGSAAAVASGMVPLALSTQTGGSIIRPAAYCGVPALKPSFGMVSRAGMTLTSESLDTIGWHAASVDWLRRAADILLPARGPQPTISASGLRIAVIDYAPEATLEEEGRQALEAAVGALRNAGADCQVHDASAILNDLVRAHTAIMKYEFARNLAPLVRQYGSSFSPSLLQNVEEGWRTPDSLYLEMCALQHGLRTGWQDVSGGADFILAPAAAGCAPRGHEFTGAPAFNKCWTVLGWPCLHLPVVRNEEGLPTGIQLIGRWKHDFDVIELAGELERLLEQN